MEAAMWGIQDTVTMHLGNYYYTSATSQHDGTGFILFFASGRRIEKALRFADREAQPLTTAVHMTTMKPGAQRPTLVAGQQN